VQDEEDALVSEELGVRMVPGGTDLVMFDSKTGQQLLAPDELHDLTEELKQQSLDNQEELHRVEHVAAAEKQRADREKHRAEAEKQQAQREKQRADEATQRAEQEKQRADALAAEVERLRAKLQQPPI
jgi:hypothetical protein